MVGAKITFRDRSLLHNVVLSSRPAILIHFLLRLAVRHSASVPLDFSLDSVYPHSPAEKFSRALAERRLRRLATKVYKN